MAYLANSLNLGPGVLDLAGFNVWRGGGNGFVAELAVAPDILGTASAERSGAVIDLVP